MDPTLRKPPLLNFGFYPIYCNTRNEASQLSLLCDNKGRPRTISRKKSYRISSIRWHGYSLHVSVWLLFGGGVYFIGTPAEINDGWKRYIRVIQWRLLDAGSSTCNLSVLLSAMEKSCTTRTALALAQWPLSKLLAYLCALPRVCRALLRLFEGGV